MKAPRHTPRRALVMVGMVSLAVLTILGAVRATQGRLEALAGDAPRPCAVLDAAQATQCR